jgi:hypothetical protein
MLILKVWRINMISLCLLLLSASISWASPVVFPLRVVLSDKNKTAQVSLRHVGNKPTKYRISLVYYIMSADGSLKEEKVSSNEKLSARDLIRYSPKQVLLQPNSEQIVRLILRKPAGIAEGEYRIHMHFEEELVDDATTTTATADSGEFSMSLKPRLAVAIPVLVRQGAPMAKVRLSNLKLVTIEKTKQAISLEIANDGNANVYGDMKVYQVLSDGQKKIVGEVYNVSSLTAKRKATFVLSEANNLDLTQKTKLFVELRQLKDDGGGILATAEE